MQIMQTLFKVLTVALLALAVSGFNAGDLFGKSNTTYHEVQHIVRSGETLWQIGEMYYDGSKPFAEFMYDLKEANGFRIGGGREYLQVGDIVKIKVADQK